MKDGYGGPRFSRVAGSVRRRPIGPSSALAIFLLAALGIGIAAIFLTAPTSAPAGPGTTTYLGRASALTIGLALLTIPLSIALYLLHGRVRGGSAAYPTRALSVFMVAFLVALVFLAIIHFIPAGPELHSNNTTTAPGGGTGAPNQTLLLNNSTPPNVKFPPLSTWGPYLGLGIALVVVIAIVAPLMSRGRLEPPAESSPPSEAAVREELGVALQRLGSADPSDARAILIELYGRLLLRLSSKVDRLESATPGEIEQMCIDRFRIRPATARALRTLFEEARYSTLPMGAAQVAAARGALTDAMTELGPEPLRS